MPATSQWKLRIPNTIPAIQAISVSYTHLDVYKRQLFLFSDEVYREFIYTGSPYISACHLEGIENNVVLIDSVSRCV